MTGLEPGMTVKVKPSVKKYAPAGTIEDIENGIANVKYGLSYSRGGTYEKVAVENLIHVCKRLISRGHHHTPCGKPVKEGNLCGIHAAADRRAQANQQKASEEEMARTLYGAETDRLTKAMQGKLDGHQIDAQVLNARNNTVSISLDILLGYVTTSRSEDSL